MRRFEVCPDGGSERRFAIVFRPGDDILNGLTGFAENEHLGASQFTAIGGVSEAVLGWFDEEKKMYREVAITRQAEVLSLVGDVARLGDKPVVHAHMTVAFEDGSTRGGHLLSAVVSPTLEVMLVESPHALRKEHDDDAGIDFIVPDDSP